MYYSELGEAAGHVRQRAGGIVRLSKIKVYPQYLDEYMKFATEVGEISLWRRSQITRSAVWLPPNGNLIKINGLNPKSGLS